jgi:hypothetical protein
MKTIRNITILVGLSAALFILVATGARAQELSTTSFAGTFTLPFDTQWGAMTLPAGDYNLSYGMPFKGGNYAVVVAGKAEASPRGMILTGPRNDVSAAKNALVCIREGDVLFVRALELPAIGESISFALPHGAQVTAHQRNGSTNFQLAEAPVLIQRLPVLAAAK